MNFITSSIFAFALLTVPIKAMPSNGTSPNLSKRLGINCRGSGMCNGLCGITLDEVMEKVDTLPDDQRFGNGEHVACVRCISCSNCRTHPHLCVFPQAIEGRKVDTHGVKIALKKLKEHGCGMCGSYPIHENDCSKGMITVNFVTLVAELEESKTESEDGETGDENLE